MRYEDTSSSVGNSATPEARDDADALATGSNGPATGNVITGAGTLTGQAGADGAPNGHVVEIRGAGGTDTADKGQSMHVDGRYGALVIDENGNYKYVADGHAPEDFRDLFQYTLVDAKGGRSMADLVISRGAELKIADNAQRVVPGPDGVVTLPAGVDLNDVHVLGRDLVVTLPDGSQIVIVDGAVFVPQLVLGGVEVPSTNLASLLIQSELITAAGSPQSSGGNFDVPVPPLDPGVPLGDLIPPTELHFTPPEFEELGDIIDRDPEAGSVSVLLDDDDVPGKNGNAGGTGDDAGSPGATASGVLPGSGGDGALTWDLQTSGAPAGFSYVDGPNGSILVQQVQDGNTVTVLTITIDPTDGSFTVTENAPIRHATGDNENNANFTINYTVTDSDGDVAAGTLNINVDDDTPTVSVTAGSDAQVSLTTHDALTPGAGQEAVSTTADFSNVFGGTSSSPGADGAGAGSTSGYALSTTGGASGLFSHGVAINLYNVGGVIIGSTAATAPASVNDPSVVFSVSTTNTGIVTLTQYQQIDHTNADPSPTGSPFDDHSISLADGAITLTRSLTVVDKDGDSVTGSAAVQIGANLHFLDDGPTIGIADRGEPSLTVDETDLGTNATASFAANFSASFGADGPAAAGSITYALGINAGASGLIDVATGQAIVLVNNAGVIEGHVGSAAGALAFTVSVNAAGEVTLDQIRALQHPDGSNPDDSVTLANDNLVTLTATAHDFDGDTATSTINIGQNLNFEDDGPSINTTGAEPDLTVDETVLATNATASVAGAFSSSFGADGAGTVTYALGISGVAAHSGLIDTLTGEVVRLHIVGGVVEGRTEGSDLLVFTVSIDADGNVTLDQLRAVVHPNAANPDDSVTLGADSLVTVTATVTDKDGDSQSATINFGQNLHFEDDGPSITPSGQEPSLTVDETILATNASASFAGAFTPNFGADGPLDANHDGIADAGAVTYALSITGGDGTDSGLIDVASGQPIVLVNNGGVIEGHVGSAAGALAFTVTVNAAGSVTLDQILAVQHPNPLNPDDSVTLASDNLVVLTATAHDGDGDTASSSINIGQNLNFEDDGPQINANGEQPSLTVDETTLATNASASFAGVFISSFGADGAGTITYALGISAPGANSGLIDVATGQAIVLVNNAGVIEGHVGNAAGAIAFTVSIDGNTGVVTLDQVRAVQHPNPNNPDDSVTLSADSLVTITATITDRDGDQQSATANIGQNLNFEDDGPSISLATQAEPQLTVDETVLLTDSSSSFAGAFNSSFGADGAGTVSYALSILSSGAASGLVDTLSGSPIVLVMSADGTFVEGRVGNALGAVAFTVTVDASGNVTLDQQRAVIHPNPNNPDDSITLSADNLVQLTATVTDKDGDHQSATLNIGQNLNFEDDGPSAVNDSDTVPSGGNTAQGNVITGIGTDGGAATADNAGADQPGHITAIQGTDGTDTTFSGGVLSIHGSFGTLEIDANGNYTYTRDPGTPGTVQDVFTYTLTDADGDSTTATLTINISDAAPNPPAPVTVLLDDDALAGGNSGGPGDRSPDTQNTVGNLIANGGDGDLDYFIAASQTLPTGFTSNLTSLAGVQTLQISQNGTLVITVTLTNETGAYTVTQNAPIMHAADGNTEGEIPLGNILSAINVNVFAQDADGDQSGNAVISISVDDDTPTVTANGTQPSLTVDETVLATNASADFSGIFSHSFGADGAALANSITYALAITGGNGVDSGLDDVATGQNIVLVNNAGVIEGHVGNAAGALAFTVTVDAAGTVTLDQIRAVTHPNAADPDDSVSLANDNLITLTQTVTDKDGDQQSATANIGQNLNFEDDGPSAAIVESGQGVSIDESAGNQLDSNDVTGPLTVFNVVANKGVDPDMVPQFATNAAAIVTSTGSAYGADGAGTTVFSLNLSSAGVDSGLNTTSGQDIFLFKEGDLIVGRVGNGAGPAAFAIAIDPATGAISMVEYLSIQHPNAANPDDSVSIADGALLATVTVTDRDGDSASQSTAIGDRISFQDSGPVMTAAQNINIQNSGDVAHTGQFAFLLGADGANATNDVITNVTGSATVGGVPVTNWNLTAGVEDATTASYTFSFDYSIGGGVTAHETGTLVFDKVAGTYTIDLANPIQGVTTILQTATGTLFQGYEPGTSTVDGSQPAISVTQIQDLAGTANDIYVQFTSVSEPSSGTGDNNLEFSNWVPGANNPAPVNGGGDTTWNPGQVFNQTDGWVSTSNDANGVDGDTIQGGEVLDFNLVQGLNPTGILADPSTYAQASSMFLKFDGIGSAEDMIILVKVYDTVAHTYSTVALMVQNSDIQKGPGSGPGIYSGITLDQNDGLIIIEPNDYQQGNTNLVIVGAQIAGSDEGLSGTAIDFTYGGVLGVASTGTQAFSTDTSDGPFKISSIGFTTVQTTPQNAQLDFNVTVTDGDGDSITQAISATVTAAADSTSAATIPAANTTVAPVVLDLNGDGAHFLATDAGVHYDYGSGSVATAWASPQDGILVNDANHNGTVDNASEFVFGSGNVTDLQALVAYDSNHDGQLSSADAGFANFAVWQDANSNGVADAGEVQSLTARGIASISLSSDGIAYAAAGGDVQVAGTGSYTRADGSTGSLADAAFLTGDRAASVSNTALLGAIAAAGLASQAAAASTHASLVATTAMASVAVAHNQALTPVALDYAPDMHASTLLSPQADLHGLMEAHASIIHASDFGDSHALRLDPGHSVASQAPMQFLQGTQMPAHDGAAAMTAASIAMPSAQQLVGANIGGVSGAQHNAVIGQVLAEALHGGAGGSIIDHALASLPGHGANFALEALASHGGLGVPNGDTGVFAAFTAAHSAFNMEAMVVHADAVQTHA